MERMVRTAMAVAAWAAAVVGGAGCEGRADIFVTCRVERTNVVCTAEHMKGTAAGKACWDMNFGCSNGTKATQRICRVVEPKATEIVRIVPKEVPGLAACDGVADFQVDHLEVVAPD